jgi:hypothetical protein
MAVRIIFLGRIGLYLSLCVLCDIRRLCLRGSPHGSAVSSDPWERRQWRRAEWRWPPFSDVVGGPQVGPCPSGVRRQRRW